MKKVCSLKNYKGSFGIVSQEKYTVYPILILIWCYFYVSLGYFDP